MDAANCSQTLEILDNGIKAPLYSDRQVVRASDLMLDRESHDEALARMRRLLHGWGIVSGFDLIQDEEGQRLVIGEGYGISPSGAEVFLPEAVEIGELIDLITQTCGQKNPGCEVFDDASANKAFAAAAAENAGLGAWLIARPTSRTTSPRAAVPEGCDNPGNQMLNTRRCHQVQFDLLCSLPSDKLYSVPPCDETDPYICAGEKLGIRRGVPFQSAETLGSSGDYIVLGYLQLVEGRVEPQPYNRRPLLPTQVMQDWLMSCLCPVLHAPAPEPTPEPDPDPVDDSTDDTPDDDTSRPGKGVSWADILTDFETLHGKDIYDTDPQVDLEDLLNDGHTDPVPDLMRLMGPMVIEKFQNDGIDGPVAFLEADIDVLAMMTGIEPSRLLQFRQGFVKYEANWATIGMDRGAIVNAGGAASVAANRKYGASWDTFERKMTDAGLRTNWTEAGNTAATEAARGARAPSMSAEPMLTAMTGSSDDLVAKGYASPADVVAASNEALAADLGVSANEAAVIKMDLMRFTSMMGGGVI